MFKSSTSARRGSKQVVAKDSGKRKCNICMEEFDRKALVDLVCKHRWCEICMNDTFIAATKYRTRYPPKCCHLEIKVDHVSSRLKDDTRKEYQSKKLEWDCVNPTYCRNPRCSAFLDKSRIRGMEATCPKPDCGRKTCIKCKMVAHGSTTCPKKEEDSKMRALATEWNWKHCPDCQSRIELSQGCAITTCTICNCKFCFACLRIGCNDKCRTGKCEGHPRQREWEKWRDRKMEVEKSSQSIPTKQSPQRLEHQRAQSYENRSASTTENPKPTSAQEQTRNQIRKISLPSVTEEGRGATGWCNHDDFLDLPVSGWCQSCYQQAHTYLRRCTKCFTALCATCIHLSLTGRGH